MSELQELMAGKRPGDKLTIYLSSQQEEREQDRYTLRMHKETQAL